MSWPKETHYASLVTPGGGHEQKVGGGWRGDQSARNGHEGQSNETCIFANSRFKD